MKNPDWNRNELILALNLYFSLSFGQMDGKNPDIKKLSNLLSLSNLNSGFSRSISSVSLKLANFKRIDPISSSKGMTGGGKLEKDIWNEFSGKRDQLKDVADTIKKDILESRKRMFIQWLEGGLKPDGTSYQRNTIQTYANQVDNTIFSEFAINKQDRSLYEVTNIEELEVISMELHIGEDNKRRKDLRSAFQSYFRFILNTTDQEIETDQFQKDEEGESRTEGGRKVYISSKPERDPALRKRAIKQHGTTCKACNFNFGEIYGDWGNGYIEVHHLTPLGDNETGERMTNSLNDLIVLCANCHRMVHRRKGITLSLEELKQKINRAAYGREEL
ncbi:HNH endonuclease [uncultured Fluviicola sp.]|uniref:HNH endonuclease n=1 Tax=uncultured Fluviicola sp. TaxID=463303 RepID=UPI0025F568C6|nr:HNH endonuclease [uncultured Fluviicola sp.]